MSNIDWSKAPEGATHYWPANGHFYTEIADRVFVIAGQSHLGEVASPQSWIDSLVKRPSSPWLGEGLPPVGTVCEFHGGEGDPQDPWHPSLKDGAEVTVIAHYNNMGTDVAVFTFLDSRESVFGTQVDQADASCFLPARSPEQIAAEERNKAINELSAEMYSRLRLGTSTCQSVAACLYDKGYRKVEGGEK